MTKFDKTMTENAPEVKRETIEEFLARGGKIQAIPPRTTTMILKTFSARKIRSANTASPRGRADRAETKAIRNLSENK